MDPSPLPVELLSPHSRKAAIEDGEISTFGARGADTHDVGRGSNDPDQDWLNLDLGPNVEPILERLVKLVQSRLPWVSRESGETVGMRVAESGYLDSDSEPFARGTAFVRVEADGREAAIAACESLQDLARLPDSYWIAGWERTAKGAFSIKVYPVDSLDSVDG